MNNRDEKLYQIFFSRFAHDKSMFLVPRLPYFDHRKQRQIIDYAILSQDKNQKRVAILIRAAEKERTPEQQREIREQTGALKSEGWIPVVFSADDIEFRPQHVRVTLEDLFEGKHFGNETETQHSKRLFPNLIALVKHLIQHNMEVIAFSACFFMVLSASFMWSLREPPQNLKLEKAAIPNSSQVDVLMMDQIIEKTQNAIKPVKLLHTETPMADIAEYQGKILPIVNLDNMMPSAAPEAPGQASSDTPSDKVMQPIYTATVRFCNSGKECTLKNNSRIELWGVDLPADPYQQINAHNALNEMVAGQKIRFEVKETLGPDKMLVKAAVGDTDIAQALVGKGILKPLPGLDTIRPPVGNPKELVSTQVDTTPITD